MARTQRGAAARVFITACEDLRIELLLEPGAQRAETSVEFVTRLGGRAIAFEANPNTFESITSLAAEYGVEVRNVAVGDRVGQATLHIPVQEEGDTLTSGSTSILQPVAEPSFSGTPCRCQ